MDDRMNQSARAWVWILAIMAISGASVCLYALIAGNEPLLAIGLPIAALSAALLPVLVGRRAKQGRLAQREGLLAEWEYGPDEARIIACEHRRLALKRNLSLAAFFSVCIVIILSPIFFSLNDSGEGVPLLLIEASAMLLLLPWVVAFASPALQARRILLLPCQTLLGRDCLVIANRYHALNDYSHLTAEHAKLIPAGAGMALLRVTFSYRAGKRPSTYRKAVDIPVPAGKEREAEEIARTLC